jgi:hypothetical protein
MAFKSSLMLALTLLAIIATNECLATRLTLDGALTHPQGGAARRLTAAPPAPTPPAAPLKWSCVSKKDKKTYESTPTLFAQDPVSKQFCCLSKTKKKPTWKKTKTNCYTK